MHAAEWSTQTLCRWDADTGWFETYAPNKRFGSFVDDVELFDNAFFSIAQPEAVAMDAQQRLLLEASYEALQLSTPRTFTGMHRGILASAQIDGSRFVLTEDNTVV